MKIDDNVLTESETARVVGVSVSVVHKWRREGSGPTHIRIGRPVESGPCLAGAVMLNSSIASMDGAITRLLK